MIKQVSVFMENRSGRIHEITRILGENNINIRALSLADTSDFGILRLIVNNPDKAIEILKKANYTVSETDVLAIEVSDAPGGLAQILHTFAENTINVEYMYVFLGKKSKEAIFIVRFDDIQSVLEKLKSTNIKQISPEELYGL